MRAQITASTTTTLGVCVLVAGATWAAAAHWFGYQNDVASQMAAMNARLVKIEAKLEVLGRGL